MWAEREGVERGSYRSQGKRGSAVESTGASETAVMISAEKLAEDFNEITDVIACND